MGQITKKYVFYMLTAPVVRKLFWSDMCANTICVESISYISINILDTLVSKLQFLNFCWIYLERALSFFSSRTLSWASRYTWYAAPKSFLSNLLQRSASSKQASENLKKKMKILSMKCNFFKKKFQNPYEIACMGVFIPQHWVSILKYLCHSAYSKCWVDGLSNVYL